LYAMPISATASGGCQMPEPESFIVKIWVEQGDRDSSSVQWRGSVTHVPGGERHSISDVTEIAVLIMEHLREMGVQFGMKWRIWLWLFRR
jgi:hypothetical protein